MNHNEQTEVSPVKHLGCTYPVFVNYQGVFLTRFDDVEVRDVTHSGLEKKIKDMAAKRKPRVAIRVSQLDHENKVRHGTATGIHAATGNVTVTWDDGESGQLRGYDHKTILLPLDEEAEKTLQELIVKKKAAQDAFKAFVESFQTDILKTVTDALAALTTSGSSTKK